MKGFTNKQPKIVAACVDVLTRALRYVTCFLLNLISVLHICQVTLHIYQV